MRIFPSLSPFCLFFSVAKASIWGASTLICHRKKYRLCTHDSQNNFCFFLLFRFVIHFNFRFIERWMFTRSCNQKRNYVCMQMAEHFVSCKNVEFALSSLTLHASIYSDIHVYFIFIIIFFFFFGVYLYTQFVFFFSTFAFHFFSILVSVCFDYKSETAFYNSKQNKSKWQRHCTDDNG